MIFYLFYYIFEGMSIVNLRWNNRLVSEVTKYSSLRANSKIRALYAVIGRGRRLRRPILGSVK